MLATSFFFNNFQSSQEQQLIEDLVIESIKIYGHDIKYIKRELQNKDRIYGEDRQTSRYVHALSVEMYIKNVDGFQGEGDFLSKFNLEIRDQITFTVSRSVFSEEIGSPMSVDRPREGDLIYFPLNRKIFEIKFVEHEPIFYQMGALQMYDLKCELFEYNGEMFNTGDPEIDFLYNTTFLGGIQSSTLLTDQYNSQTIVLENGDVLVTEGDSIEEIDLAADNDTIQREADDFLDFSEKNPFSEGGVF
ncbi:MAG: hypothetical protein EBS98_08660 [Chitinophagia bacterium]|nr:hypothetical protein [Chitinophagia bacterium]